MDQAEQNEDEAQSFFVQPKAKIMGGSQLQVEIVVKNTELKPSLSYLLMSTSQDLVVSEFISRYIMCRYKAGLICAMSVKYCTFL